MNSDKDSASNSCGEYPTMVVGCHQLTSDRLPMCGGVGGVPGDATARSRVALPPVRATLGKVGTYLEFYEGML